jgi:PhoD-like phosphatase
VNSDAALEQLGAELHLARPCARAGTVPRVPELVLGPVLRYASDTKATVWVETDAPCEVEVLGHRTRTFAIEGHHYGLLHIEGLEPGRAYEYGLRLDGEEVWPEPGSGFPPSAVRTLEPERAFRLLFASCRAAAPHVPPYTLSPDADAAHGLELDALRAYTLRMLERPREEWPDSVLFLGDQVYADEASPATREFIRRRRNTRMPPGEEVADFEEYTRLYHESWGEPVVRWFLANVPSAMIFDDHDVHDDWNSSAWWVAQMREQEWWKKRITAAFMSYWLYQHLGNLSPEDAAEDETYTRVRAADDAGTVLREFALRADRETAGTRWSYHRDFGPTRLVVMDSRAGRQFEHGRREMVDDEEWARIVDLCSGEFDHLLLASSLPLFLPRAAHFAEAWSEALAGGAWGGVFARLGEALRRKVDLEHWAAFESSFTKLTDLITDVARGARGPVPTTIVALSGDVHFSYLAEVGFPRAAAARSIAYQAVCSPMRNPLPRLYRLVQRVGFTHAGELIGEALARAAGVAPPAVGWRIVEGPSFHNSIASLDLEGRRASLRVERTTSGDGADPGLETVFVRELARG